MTFIYIDESGDLGMDCRESRYFIITAVKIGSEEANKEFLRISKRIRQRKLKKSLMRTSELKFSNSSVLIREMYLKRAANLEIEVYSLIIDKKFTSDQLKDSLPILYNYLIKVLFEKILPSIPLNNRLDILLDKCMSASQRENFEAYIHTEFFYLFKALPNVTIRHEISQNSSGLQVVDFICGAFGYKYNAGKLQTDSEHYTDIIKQRIKVEKNDLFRRK
jgi:hypothetical protein